MNKGVVIFIEGDTEKEIYDKFIDKLHSMCPNKRFSIDKLIIRNLKGIGNYKNRAIRVFTKEIIPKNPDVEFDIFLCYDTDVFEFSSKPPVDWKDVEKALKEAGAKNIVHVQAKRSIEDWILNDLQGIFKYLKLSDNVNFHGSNGADKLKNLFGKVNKPYVKGASIKGFADSLDIEKVMCSRSACTQLKLLCVKLGIKCKKS